MTDFEVINENKRVLREFISINRSESEKQVKEILTNKRDRLIINLNELEKFNTGITDRLLAQPTQFLPVFDEALADAVTHEDSDSSKRQSLPRIGFKGVVGSHSVTPRGLTSHVAGHMVCVEGIVSRCTTSRPRAKVTVHYTNETGEVRVRDHRDATAIVTDLNSSSGVPTKDDNGNLFVTAHGLSLYRDYQKFTLQEMPETAPTGQMPKSVDVLVTDDLVDSAKPGDRVAVVGVYRPIANSNGGITSGAFRFVIVANNVFQLNQQIKSPPLTTKDIKNIKQIAGRKDAYSLLGRSFAPSISGRDWEKKGLLLQQFGGAEKNLDNGAHLRGDINVLLIGDPSCGKSQLLRFVLNISPLAISTTGRGSTGVGLTAAVTLDRETNEKQLEAGAMVLADRGVVCIDEFDKMSVNDRVAIHEVMEQQTVTIAKAGIHTTLNARCSVLAAANPVYGNFDPSIDLSKNINLPDSILSRFDLVFIVRDLMSKVEDRKIATQVLRQIQYRPQAPTSTAAPTVGLRSEATSTHLEPRNESITKNSDVTSEVFDKSLMAMAHLETGPRGGGGSQTEFVTVEFLRKYISYARNLPAPVLSERSIDAIAEVYSNMRQTAAAGDSKFTLCVTPRTLEAIIRLSTAHAKLLLKSTVDPADVQVAHEILMQSRGSGFEAIGSAGEEPAAAGEEERMSDGEEEEVGQENVNTMNTPQAPKSAKKKKPAAEPESDDNEPLRDVTATPAKKARMESQSSSRAGDSQSTQLNPKRLELFTEHAVDVISGSSDGFVNVSDLLREINKRIGRTEERKFPEAESKMCLDKLAQEHKIMIDNNDVFLL
jgi:DNA replication licensing factor MCM3